MYEELEKLDELSLLQLYSADPRSEEGQAADAVLRYRQYLASKFYNKVLIYITVILAIWGGLQSFSAGVQALAAWRSIHSSASQPVTHTDAPPKLEACDGMAAETLQIKDLAARIAQLESKSKRK
jgi:hypothetical protein